MSIIQFLRILWARRWVVVGGTVSCVIGAIIVGMILPPRWQAHSRVMLDLVKPDPVTGQVFANGSTRAYVQTQVELIKDYSVAGQVADDLHLLSDPSLIRQYESRPSSDKRDFRRWVAQLLIDRTEAELVAGSNILQITYTGPRPDDAKRIADSLRKAYIEASRAFRVEQAAKNAEWYEGQAEKARVQLDDAEKIKTAFEKEKNIILGNQDIDVDSARLQAMAGQTAMPAPIVSMPFNSPARSELAQVDSAIAQESQILGPNHPDLQALRNKRASLAQQVLQDQATSQSAARAAVGASSAGIGALDRMMSAQRAKVMSQRDNLERLRQLQSDVALRRDLYTKTAERAAEFRHEAAAPVTGITMLGSAVIPQSPKFPNWPLIIFGSLVLGLGTGVLTGLLMELFGRRIRGPEDLSSALDAPLLAVVASRGPSGRTGGAGPIFRRRRKAARPGSGSAPVVAAA
jgi:polysaccharide biosynthesis transport protein